MTLSLSSTVTLSDGNKIPMLGLGVFMSKDLTLVPKFEPDGFPSIAQGYFIFVGW